MADHHLHQHHHHGLNNKDLNEENDDLDRLFPKCRPPALNRLNSAAPASTNSVASADGQTAVLIDLSDENHKTPLLIHHHPSGRRPPHEDDDDEEDSADSDQRLQMPLNAHPAYFANHHLRRSSAPKSSELRRPTGLAGLGALGSAGSLKMRRQRTLDTWIQFYDTCGGGYEPSPDSEDNDSDHVPGNYSRTTGSGGSGGSSKVTKSAVVRSSASESHIAGHWRKQEVAYAQSRYRTAKEVYDLTPTRPPHHLVDGATHPADGNRLEIAGGREIVSRSRIQRPQRKRPSANNSASSSSGRSINRYSGEVYYEESVGRYGFHVDGNTLWGSQGLEPSFSIASSLNEKQSPSSLANHGVKRPLSWAGDADDEPPDPANGEETTPESNANGAATKMGYLTDFYPEVVAATANTTPTSSASGNGAVATSVDSAPSLNLDSYLSEQLNQFAQSGATCNGKETCPAQEEAASSTATSSATSTTTTTATVIGGLTIAQYEGSPRRYGLQHHRQSAYSNGNCESDASDVVRSTSCSLSPLKPSPAAPATPNETPSLARPGFPRRVLPAADAYDQPTFSPSLTRQALAQLTSQANLTVKDVALATWTVETDGADTNNREAVSADTEDLGETEVGLVVGQSRNFTLSPETTDYDSELDAQSGCSGNGPGTRPDSGTDPSKLITIQRSGSSNGHKFTSMPILEDGLSSGHNSDLDESWHAEASDRVPQMASASMDPSKRRMMGSSHYQQEVSGQDQIRVMGLMPALAASPASSSSSSPSSASSSSAGINQTAKGRHAANATAVQQQQLWVKKMVSHHLEYDAPSPPSLNSSYRSRDATPPPPAPHAHRPAHSTTPPSAAAATTSAAMNSSPAATCTPLISPAPDTPSTNLHSSTCDSPSNGQMSCPRTMGESSSPPASANDSFGLHELKEALQHSTQQRPPPQTANANNRNAKAVSTSSSSSSLPIPNSTPRSQRSSSPVWVPRQNSEYWANNTTSLSSGRRASSSHGVDKTNVNDDDDEKETDQLLRESHRSDDQGFFDDKDESSAAGKKKGRSKEVMVHEPAVLIEGVLFRANYLGSTQIVCEGQPTKYTRMMQAEEAVSRIKSADNGGGAESAAGEAASDSPGRKLSADQHILVNPPKRIANGLEPPLEDEVEPLLAVTPDNNNARIRVNPHGDCAVRPDVNANVDTGAQPLPEPAAVDAATEAATVCAPPRAADRLPDMVQGCSFRLHYYGSLEINEVHTPSTDAAATAAPSAGRFRSKKHMVEEAVGKLKAPEGETQPSTEVDLFISTEKIMVLNTELKEIMMDHALRTISYIADIGDLVVLMARRRMISQDGDDSAPKIAKTPKMVCHVFESEEAQFIAQSIGQAFQVAYMEFLKANGIEDQSFVREMDYQEVLNSQEIFGDELQMFAKKELQKEVIVPKARNEILGVVIVESGWGSMLPTVVIANLAPAGAAARCGQLNIGDQIIAINGISLVGLPLSTCQTYIKNTKSATVVKLTVVPCPPVVEVKIKRPDTKYQLGFSVQNGVICSLLRGGIAERGGVRVGHRIIEINGQSVVAVPHERIVGLLATSVGEINMKTMPTSMFRLLIGQETPIYI